MKQKKRILIAIISVLTVILVVFAVKLFNRYRIESGYGDELNAPNRYAKEVTLIQLIATPEKYDGKLIRVIGVGNLEFEGDCLSISQEDLKYNVGNSVWLELGEKAISYQEAQAYNGHYVIVEGIFDKRDRGHMGMFCGTIKDINRYELWDVYTSYDPYDFCTITENNDLTKSYMIVDKNGNVLLTEEHFERDAEIRQIDTCVLEFSSQAGTGISTRWATYCDVENGKVSETFEYVLAAQGEYVVYGIYENGEHGVVVQHIFDKTIYYKMHTLPNVSDKAAESIVAAEFKEGVVTITYLANDNAETETSIVLP